VWWWVIRMMRLVRVCRVVRLVRVGGSEEFNG
jgi:hypothetical protein